MRIFRIGLALCLLTFAAGAAFAQKVTTDYDKGANFSQYKTFSWIKEPKMGDPLTRQRIIDEVNAALEGKGLRLVTGEADLAIAAHVTTREERTLDTFYSGFGGWRWRGGGFGSATTTVNTYDVNTLIVDIFDAKTKEAIWRGTASRTLSGNPEKNAKGLNKAVDKMFQRFPPSNTTN